MRNRFRKQCRAETGGRRWDRSWPCVGPTPSTGSACAALGGYLGVRAAGDGNLRWVVEQGFEMGRPSLIELEADRSGGRITAVRVGGETVMVSEGTMTVPQS